MPTLSSPILSPIISGLSFVKPTLGFQQQAQGPGGAQRVRVLRPKRFLPRKKRLLDQQFSLRELALVKPQPPEVVRTDMG